MGLVLAAALLVPSPASAVLTDGVATAVPDTGPVTEITAEALPNLPVPIETPDLPKVPVPLPPASKPPSESAAPEPSAARGAEAAVGAAVDKVEGMTSAPAEAGEPAAAPGSGAGSEPAPRPVVRGPDRHSVDPAEAAPLRDWRAYVWPAIALRLGDALAPLLAPLNRLVGVQMSDVFGLLPSPGVSGSAGIDRPAERSGLLGQDLQSPSGPGLPAGGMGLLVVLLIGLLMALCLVSLARLFVGEELFEVSHWRNHRR